MKNTLFYLAFLLAACNSDKPPVKQSALPNKVQLIFTNESPYLITDVSVFSDSFLGTTHEKPERRTLGHVIMPQEADTLFFDAFNKWAFSMRTFFLVNNDTIKKVHRVSDNASDYTMTSGTIKFGLYYSDKDNLIYTREIVE